MKATFNFPNLASVVLSALGETFAQSDVEYIKRVNAIDTSVRFQKTAESDVWGLILYFMNRFSDTKPENFFDHRMNTKRSAEHVTWNITKNEHPETDEISLNIEATWINSNNLVNKHEFYPKLLIHFLQTQEINLRLYNQYPDTLVSMVESPDSIYVSNKFDVIKIDDKDIDLQNKIYSTAKFIEDVLKKKIAAQ